MEQPYASPAALVEALHRKARDARGEFHALFQPAVTRLLEHLLRQHDRLDDLDHIVLHALHSAEVYVRTRPTRHFEGMDWKAFRGAVLVHVAKMASQPYGKSGALAGPGPLPESGAYHARTFFQPYERVGNHWFGGDWFGGRAEDDALWVIVADVTGHGYFAYLLACGLPEVWRLCWQGLEGPDRHPAEVLAAMHRLLVDCLPEGVFLECTLARLAPDGSVTVVPAGGTRLLVRRGSAVRPEVVRLRGLWLGLAPPSASDEHREELGAGDELLLATDGIYDQIEGHGEAEEVELSDGPATLFDAVHGLLHRALEHGPQKDDLTMVLLRRVEMAGEGGAPDVPV